MATWVYFTLPMPVVAAPGGAVTLNEILQESWGGKPASFNDFWITNYDAAQLTAWNFSYWNLATPTVDRWQINSVNIAPGLAGQTYVPGANTGTARVVVGNDIGPLSYFAVVASAANQVNFQYSLMVVDPAVLSDVAGLGAPTAQDIVDTAYAFNAYYGNVANFNDCHFIAAAVGAATGAVFVTETTQSLVTSENTEYGFWRIAYRGGDPGTVAQWQTLLQPGDIVRMGWSGPSGGFHTYLVLDTNPDGTVVVYDNTFQAPNNKIGIHTVNYDDITLANTITIYRLTTDGLFLMNGTELGETIEGTLFNDELRGLGGADTLRGGVGNDVLVGGGGNDILEGGQGADTARFMGARGAYTVTENNTTGVITVVGPDGTDTLRGVNRLQFSDQTIDIGVPSVVSPGTGGADNLVGGEGNDNLSGGNGTDTFEGGEGADTINGGAGNDTVTAANDPGPVFIQLAWNWGRDGWGDEDSIVGIENIRGSNYGDVLIGAAGANVINGGGGSDWIEDVGDGNDTLNGEAGNDIIFGGAGNDTLTGGENDDALLGGIGNDSLDGGAGIDWIYAGEGADTIIGGAGNDVLFGGDGGGPADGADNIQGGDGDDALIGEQGDDTLSGGNGVDWAYGGAGNDNINGAAGDDVLIGGDGAAGSDGNDTITGGDGNDSLIGQIGDDTLNADAGNDWAYGGLGNDAINGGAGNDVLAGEQGDDTINGGDGDDFLFGAEGNDILNGGAGNDWIEGSFGGSRITGGAGADSLFGGDGAHFIYTNVSESTEAVTDTISNFWRGDGIDRIDVSAIDADGNAGNGVTDFSFVGAFSNVAGQAVITWEPGNNRSVLRFDVNGDGASDMTIVVLGVQIVQSDFIL